MAYAPALNLESRISDQNPPCDLCGATESDLVLTTPRLDGPLVRCRDCGLFYVVFPENGDVGQTKVCHTSPVASEMARLAERARELDLISPEVEASERPWRELAARERLDDLKRFVTMGRFLEIGSSTGELLASASSSFTVTGVEADERTGAAA